MKKLGYIILILGAISMLLPFIYMLSLSFMTDSQIFSANAIAMPSPFTFDNYKYVVKSSDILRYFYIPKI